VLKPNRAFLFVLFLLACLAALPLAPTLRFRSSLVSFLAAPLRLSRELAQGSSDLWYFRHNAAENRVLKARLASSRAERFYETEALIENRRLNRLLELEQVIPPSVRRTVRARVIGRSPLSWNRVFLIDKGTREGVRANMLVLSEVSLVGKVIEAGPSASKVLLVTDPNLRIGAIVQRSRQQGILYGALSGECRMKYVAVETDVQEGDEVETAGFGGFFPKGLRIGRVRRIWKEPGQIYKVAEVAPFADLNRVEEVVCVE